MILVLLYAVKTIARRMMNELGKITIIILILAMEEKMHNYCTEWMIVLVQLEEQLVSRLL